MLRQPLNLFDSKKAWHQIKKIADSSNILFNEHGHLVQKKQLPTSGYLSPHLRLLSFNIHAGKGTTGYSDYFVNGWRQLLPGARHGHLNKIAHAMHGFDLVALQEVDGGSLRSGFINQLHYLAEVGHYPFQFQQVNRNFGRFGQFCNGMLAKHAPFEVESHALPGLKGRGAIVSRFGNKKNPLVVVALHLALTARVQKVQLEYIYSLVKNDHSLIIMGDLNCHVTDLKETSLSKLGLKQVSGHFNTFPSWRPERSIDHILVSSDIMIEDIKVLPFFLSDHLPIAMEVRLPDSVIG